MTLRHPTGIALAGATIAIGCAWPHAPAVGQTAVVKRVACPPTVTVSAIGDLGRWTAAGQEAPYTEIVLSQRNIGGRPHFVAVCSYSAFGGLVTVERIMGPAEALGDCRTLQGLKGKGGGEIQCR
jgi:hypothetical protein